MKNFEVQIKCTVKSWSIFHEVEAEGPKEAGETAIEEILQDHIEIDQNNVELAVAEITIIK